MEKKIEITEKKIDKTEKKINKMEKKIMITEKKIEKSSGSIEKNVRSIDKTSGSIKNLVLSNASLFSVTFNVKEKQVRKIKSNMSCKSIIMCRFAALKINN